MRLSLWLFCIAIVTYICYQFLFPVSPPTMGNKMAKPVLCVSTSKIALNTYKLQQQGQIPAASYFNCASYFKKENSLEMIRTCLSATRIVNSFDKASNNEAFATYYLKQCMADRQYLPDVLAFDI